MTQSLEQRDKDRIQTYAQNPFYFQFKGQPVLLAGGTQIDCLFHLPDLEKHLDLLASVGGNYVRCTMSGRANGAVWEYAFDPQTKLYDLTRWRQEYWDRFANLLRLTAERDIIVQIEVWATWDFYQKVWSRNPYNPKKNTTYTAAEANLEEEWFYHPAEKVNPFFETVPELKNNAFMLDVQRRFVEKILSYSLEYDHVLYCMDNETSTESEWGFYWNEYIKSAARERGLTVETTEMWNSWDSSVGQIAGALQPNVETTGVPHPFLERAHPGITIENPDRYSFVDVSNQNAQKGHVHYQMGMYIRSRLIETETIRPITCTKIYGGDRPYVWSGTRQDGVERFWRNLFCGMAACRFHRPPTGIGLNEMAQSSLKSVRLLEKEMDWFAAAPDAGAIASQTTEEIYALSVPGESIALCFVRGGEATVDCAGLADKVRVSWLDPAQATWVEQAQSNPGTVTLTAPDDGLLVCLIK